jgi:hypothetical protein
LLSKKFKGGLKETEEEMDIGVISEMLPGWMMDESD